MARPQRQISKVIIIPERPRRPEAKKEFKLQGGWIMHPPEHCKKKKMDADKIFWAETCICAYRCNDRINCKAFDFLMAGSKDRRKFRTEGEI